MAFDGLRGTVAVVTGASRGVGKGVAFGLGEVGATVYVTGRTTAPGGSPWPGTITATADDVTRLGGAGIAVHCDHRDDAQVEALFRQVYAEQGRLDVLVNNATSYPSFGEGAGGMPVDTEFWRLPTAVWDDFHAVGLRSHYVASVYAARIMSAQRAGLIVNISSSGADEYLFNVPYGVAKAGVDRLTRDTAHELRPYGVAVVSLWPGLVRTERCLTAPGPYDMSQGDSPLLTGRAVAALAGDPHVHQKTGQSLRLADLVQAYGLTDAGS